MTARNSYLKRRLWWVRHWFWLADDMNNAFGEFDNTIMDVFDLRTRFKLGKLPCSGDVETEPSQGQVILDSLSMRDVQKRMRPKYKRRRNKKHVLPKKGSFKRLSDIEKERQILDDNLSFILGEQKSAS